MNRAARRAAGMHKARKAAGSVRVSNRIAVVPMAHIDTYLEHEILNEGTWATGCNLIVIRPPEDAGRDDDRWLSWTLEKMRETRRRKGTLPWKFAGPDGNDVEIDIGLIDVTVFFQPPPGMPPTPATKEEYRKTFDENARHMEMLCAGALHDQMILATCMHVFHSNGSLLLHYHNLIFGLRQEVRGDMDLLGPLDLDPLLKALAGSGPLSVIGGRKQ
jgi:hypothetical protein